MSQLAEYDFPEPHWYCECGYEKMVPWNRWTFCPYCGMDRPADAQYFPANWVGKSRGKKLSDVKKTWRFEFDDHSEEKKKKKDTSASGSSSKRSKASGGGSSSGGSGSSGGDRKGKAW